VQWHQPHLHKGGTGGGGGPEESESDGRAHLRWQHFVSVSDESREESNEGGVKEAEGSTHVETRRIERRSGLCGACNADPTWQ
jgi:hypothetical protein